MIESVRQGLESEGVSVPITKLCRWFEMPRRTLYYKPTKAAPKVQERFEKPIKAMIDQDPSFGYRTVANLLSFNKILSSGSFRFEAGRSRSAPLALDLGYKPCRLSQQHPMSAGRLICAESGRAETVGPAWHWSSIVTPESCWVGIFPDLAKPKRRKRRWSRH